MPTNQKQLAESARAARFAADEAIRKAAIAEQDAECDKARESLTERNGDKMPTVKVYGASDDLIEVEGGGLTDEFGAFDEAKYLLFGDGTILRVQYSPANYSGQWKIEILATGKGTTVMHTPAKDDEDNYSDIVQLVGNLTSVRCRVSLKA